MLDFTLYLITDRGQTAGRELPAVIADALSGGIKCVQLREKDLNTAQLFELAVTLRALTRSHDARLLINDRIDVALACDADGVHLGKAGLPVKEARRLLGHNKLIGYSAHGVAEAAQAEHDGADFVTVGPVYYTPSKAEYGLPLGLNPLTEAARKLKIPVFALGGVKLTDTAEIMATGCHGIAMISAILGDINPATAAGSFVSAISGAANAR